MLRIKVELTCNMCGKTTSAGQRGDEILMPAGWLDAAGAELTPEGSLLHFCSKVCYDRWQSDDTSDTQRVKVRD